jgi:hypothetical protein
MIRKLGAAVAAVLCVAGFGVATSGTAIAGDGGGGAAQRQSVIPHHGTYHGTDQHGRNVSFTFGGAHSNEMTHFSVAHLVIGGAHVSNGMWHETCHNGYCTKGQWTSDGHVSGSWRPGGGTWTTWSASFNPPSHPYTGTYVGRDHRQLSVHLSYRPGTLVDFKLDHNVLGSAPVTLRHFDTCFQHVCIKGHWQTDHEVVGQWRYANSHEWIGWEAYAYSA